MVDRRRTPYRPIAPLGHGRTPPAGNAATGLEIGPVATGRRRPHIGPMPFSKSALAAALAGWLIAGPAVAFDTILSGPARVIDGDTLAFAGGKVRLAGVDAPELRQACLDGTGAAWLCGWTASDALLDFIAGRSVICLATGLDRYGRYLATCTAGGADLGAWLAENGLAVPYRDCACPVIRAASARAKSARVGIWAGSFVMPWEWRKAH